MQLKLVWNNPNVVATTTKIYRATAPIDRNNLGTPVATLTQGELEWIDQNVVAGTLYYYVFESITSKDRNVSLNQQVWALPRTGPGPQKLIAGDLENGYYGDVLGSDFITPANLRAALNFTAGGIHGADTPWMKFARHGKTLFVPVLPITAGISWQQLYDAGLVYGTDDFGSSLYTGTKVNQKRVVNIGKESFLVRLMTSAAPRPDRGMLAITSTTTQTQSTGSEWDDLIYPTCEWVPATQRRSNWAAKTRSEFGSFQTTWCQELAVSNPGLAVTRGSPSYPDKTSLIFGQQISTSSVSGQYWRPVLEHIPSYPINLNL